MPTIKQFSFLNYYHVTPSGFIFYFPLSIFNLLNKRNLEKKLFDLANMVDNVFYSFIVQKNKL